MRVVSPHLAPLWRRIPSCSSHTRTNINWWYQGDIVMGRKMMLFTALSFFVVVSAMGQGTQRGGGHDSAHRTPVVKDRPDADKARRDAKRPPALRGTVPPRGSTTQQPPASKHNVHPRHGPAKQPPAPKHKGRYRHAPTKRPPPLRSEVHSRRPSSQHVWMGGHWSWRARRYVWVAGTWVSPPRHGAQWVAGHWTKRHGRWIWVAGHWKF